MYKSILVAGFALVSTSAMAERYNYKGEFQNIAANSTECPSMISDTSINRAQLFTLSTNPHAVVVKFSCEGEECPETEAFPTLYGNIGVGDIRVQGSHSTATHQIEYMLSGLADPEVLALIATATYADLTTGDELCSSSSEFFGTGL
jgi:hypothetical protein